MASALSGQSSRWGYASQLSLHDTSSELELGNAERTRGLSYQSSRFGAEDSADDEDPTITLTHARLYGNRSPSKKRASIPAPVPMLVPSAARDQPAGNNLLLGTSPTASTSAPSPSLASWRSPTPSLTRSERNAFSTLSMAGSDADSGAITETDNETETEIEGYSAIASGSTPRYAGSTFAHLFGSTSSSTGFEISPPPVDVSLAKSKGKKRGTISFPNPFASSTNSSTATVSGGLGRKTSVNGRTKIGTGRTKVVALPEPREHAPEIAQAVHRNDSVEDISQFGQISHKEHRRSTSRTFAFGKLPFTRSTSSTSSSFTSGSGFPQEQEEVLSTSPATSYNYLYNYLSTSAQSSQYSFHTGSRAQPDSAGRSTPTILNLRDHIQANRTLRSRTSTADAVLGVQRSPRRTDSERQPTALSYQEPAARPNASMDSLASTMSGLSISQGSTTTKRRPARKLTKRPESSSGTSAPSRSNTVRRPQSVSIPAAAAYAHVESSADEAEPLGEMSPVASRSRFKLFRSASSAGTRSRKNSTSTAAESGTSVLTRRHTGNARRPLVDGPADQQQGLPFPSPDRKPSLLSLRTKETGAAQQETVEAETAKKPSRRPLSITGILSRPQTATRPANTRSRSGTITAPQSASAAMQSFEQNETLAPSFSFGTGSIARPQTLAAPAGPARRGFLHRSTMSSGSIPTAKALAASEWPISSKFEPRACDTKAKYLEAGMLERRQSVEFAKQPVQIRRSFNPLFRSVTASNVPSTISERPLSTASLLSDTSTVRPLPTSEIEQQPGTPTLRRRHLPSLSLTLLPGASAPVTAQSAAKLSTPKASPLSLAIGNAEIADSPSSYFATLIPGPSNLGASPGAKSTTSSNGSASALVRRVSLSDLRIPPRISSAQAKIGQDLQRVKEFKDGVEELKRLRRIYRSLVTAEDSDASTASVDVSDTSIQLQLPGEATAKVDHIFARVAIDYQEWWEIADVLINLADGAEVVEETIAANSSADISGQQSARSRCKSEASPPTGRNSGSSASPTPASRKLGSSTEQQLDKSTPTGKASQTAEASEGQIARSSFASDEGVDVSTPTSPAVPSSQGLSPTTRSPPMLLRSKSTTVFPSRLAGEPIDDSSGSPVRGFGSPRSQSLNASERQLDILRNMLKNSSSSSTITPSGKAGPLLAVQEKSAPSSPVPSRLTAKPYLTPEKRLPTSFSLPAGLGGSTSPAKVGGVHASGSTSTLATPTAASRPARGRQGAGKSKADTVSSSDKSEGKRAGKSRLREVSRAGMQGIRDFLKALTKSGAVLERESVADPTHPVVVERPPGPSVTFAAVPQSRRPVNAHAEPERTPTRPSLALTRRVVSDSPVGSIRHTCHPASHSHTPIRNGLLSVMNASAERTNASPLSSRAGGSSDEEEDWDRRSSEDEDEHDSAGGPLLRSDTQATLLALSPQMSDAAGLPIPSIGLTDKARRRRSEGPQIAAGKTTTTLRLSGESWEAGTKLVMTTEAMPSLLAKIDEVKLHCASCVTELR